VQRRRPEAHRDAGRGAAGAAGALLGAAREMRTVARRDRPVAGSRRGARRKPPSTTIRTPGTVSEVSAMEVASTTLRRALGPRARSCSAGGISPWRGSTSASRPDRRSAVRRISPQPAGRPARRPRARPARADGAGHGFGQVARVRQVAGAVLDRHRVGAAEALDHRAVAQQPGEGGAVDGGGHGEEAQFRPQRALAGRGRARGRGRCRGCARAPRRTAPPPRPPGRGRIAGGGPGALP
jgi:hypothetical protein